MLIKQIGMCLSELPISDLKLTLSDVTSFLPENLSWLLKVYIFRFDLYGKYWPIFVAILPGLDGMKNVLASYKRNGKFINKLL